MNRALFALPLAEKMKAPHPEGLVPHRGYSSVGREQAGAVEAMKSDNEARKQEAQAAKDVKVDSKAFKWAHRLLTN